MTQSLVEALSDGIDLIDTGLIRPLHAASYLLVEGNKAAFIETGTTYSVERLQGALKARGLEPKDVAYVIATHVHLDHAGGAGALLQVLPHAKLVVHPRGARHMIDPSKLVAGSLEVYGEETFHAYYGTIVPAPKERVVEAPDGFELDLAGRTLTFLDTPGHARHHACIFDSRSRSFFTGDTFGIAYRQLKTPKGPFIFPTTTPVQFDPAALHHSIDRLLEREPRAMHLTHYGRVEDPERLARRLHVLIDAIVTMGREAPAAGSTRASFLRAGMATLLVEAYRRLEGPLSDDEVRQNLTVDIELNAQGLEVWLDAQS